MELPDRGEVIAVLDSLIAGEMTPEAASEWALPWVTERDGPLEIRDKAAWLAICAIGGADLQSLDRPYLYGVEDFQQWRAELNADT